MGAALSIFVILSLSVLVMRLAAVALRFTGLTDESARFQALSAYSGTGFTTKEAETIVNYPVRRRIISLLMIVGNMGLVTVFATLVVSLVQTDGETTAVVAQLSWFVLGLGMLWFLMLNKTADRLLCYWIGHFLESATILGKRRFHRLVQISDGFSVCKHPYPGQGLADLDSLQSALDRLNLVLLSPTLAGAETTDTKDRLTQSQGASLILFGPDSSHDTLSGYDAKDKMQ